MKFQKSIYYTIILSFMLALSSLVQAAKPQKDDGVYVGNGFPSGSHFNLNIHGKDLYTFNCPGVTYNQIVLEDTVVDDGIGVGDIFDTCPEGYVCADNEQIFGNVINMPRNDPNAGVNKEQILVESGKKGPKSKPSATELEVTDWCTNGFDGDAAVFRLPKNADGYAVYTRVTGKPVDNQTFQIDGREIVLVEELVDSDCNPDIETCATNDLLMLGVVTSDGAFVPTSDGTFERVDTSDSRGGKGVKNAVDITNVFEFSGSVCYINEDSCADSSCVATSYCCPYDDGTTTRFTDSDVGPVACVLESDTIFYDADLGEQSCDIADNEITDWVAETLYCSTYDEAWIFNIADFVNVLYTVNNNGTYNVQLRFYPLPLQ